MGFDFDVQKLKDFVKRGGGAKKPKLTGGGLAWTSGKV